MAPRSRLSIAKADILDALEQTDQTVFSRAELDGLFSENRDFWRLAKRTSVIQLIQFLEKSAGLKSHVLKFPQSLTRYSLGEAKTFEIIQSINQNGYFSHYTAMGLHGLTEQLSKSIYFNIEQRLRPGGGELSQAGINRAFASKCRNTNNVATFRGYTVYSLNGGNTDQLGVVTRTTVDKVEVRTTNLERTLIDIVVRPIYSGGVSEVAKAFSEASSRVSVNRICAYLRKIGYTYPFHQSIGFYLERTGKCSKSQLEQLEQFPIAHDFMLDYQMSDTEYVKRWRLLVPKGF